MVIIKSEVLGGGAQSTQVPTARCINQGRGRAEKPRRGKPESQPRGRSGGWGGSGRERKGEGRKVSFTEEPHKPYQSLDCILKAPGNH